MLEQLKADVDRLRSEHAFAHALYEKALGDLTVGDYLWLYGLAEDLFSELRKAEARMACAMEGGR